MVFVLTLMLITIAASTSDLPSLEFGSRHSEDCAFPLYASIIVQRLLSSSSTNCSTRKPHHGFSGNSFPSASVTSEKTCDFSQTFQFPYYHTHNSMRRAKLKDGGSSDLKKKDCLLFEISDSGGGCWSLFILSCDKREGKWRRAKRSFQLSEMLRFVLETRSHLILIRAEVRAKFSTSHCTYNYLKKEKNSYFVHREWQRTIFGWVHQNFRSFIPFDFQFHANAEDANVWTTAKYSYLLFIFVWSMIDICRMSNRYRWI